MSVIVFTEKQKQHLGVLRDLKATHADNAVAHFGAPSMTGDHQRGGKIWQLSVMVLGKLRDGGFVSSSVIRRNRQQWTVYWLTEAGAKAAESLS